LEEKLGVRAAVWVGAVALAFAGAYLVKYSFDQGILSAGVRLSLGALFGIALISAGQWLHERQRRIATGLTAAGVADLFAVLIAATSVYHLLPSVVGFALMAAVTGMAVALSLRQGMFVALLGLIGGFVTPAVVGASEPAAGPLFGYLLLLQGALLLVSRRKGRPSGPEGHGLGGGWWIIEVLTLIAGLVWAMVWMAAAWDVGSPQRFWLVAFLAGSAAAFVSMTTPPRGGVVRGLAALRLVLAYIGAGMALLLLAIVVGVGDYQGTDLLMLGLLGAGCVLLARLDERYHALAWAAAMLHAMVLVVWRMSWGVGWMPEEMSPEFWNVFLAAVTGYGAIHVLGGFAALWGSRRKAWWSGLSMGAAAVFFYIAYGAVWVGSKSAPPVKWWLVATIICGWFVAAAGIVQLRRVRVGGAREERGMKSEERGARGAKPQAWSEGEGSGAEALGLGGGALGGCRGWDGVLTWPCLGALGFAVVAMGLRLPEHPDWAAVGWALLLPVTAGAMLGLRLTTLRLPVAVLAVVVLVRLLIGSGPWAELPAIGVDDRVVWNVLLALFGVSAAAAWVASRVMRRQANDGYLAVVEWVVALGVLSWALLAVHHGFERRFNWSVLAEDVPGLGMYELATQASVMLAIGLALMAVGGASKAAGPTTWWTAGVRFAAVATAGSVVGLALVRNPLWTHEAIYGPVAGNTLLYVLGLPAALAGAWGWMLRQVGRGQDQGRRAAAGVAGVADAAALLLLFVLVSLLVRQGFQGMYLDGPEPTHAEWYAYSAAWIVFGAGLLTAGIATGSAGLRYAALAVMTVAVVKVFLFDTSHLRNLYRVFSFLGLGLSLMLLAFVYQRFQFRGRGQGRQAQG
jgi:hypothetical protein